MFEINPGLIVWTIITFVIVAGDPARGRRGSRCWRRSRRARRRSGRIAQAEKRAAARRNACWKRTRQQLARAEEQSQRITQRRAGYGRTAEGGDPGEGAAVVAPDGRPGKGGDPAREGSALQQLRSEVADLAIGAAGKILDANLDTPKQRALVDAAIREINKGQS